MAHGPTGWEAFVAVPAAALLLDVDLVVLEATDAYLALTGLPREGLLGRPHEEAFPDADEGTADGAVPLSESLRRVVATGQVSTTRLLRYDLAPVARPGAVEERWWSVVNHPVRSAEGALVGVLNVAEDVTDAIRARAAGAERDRLSEQLRSRAAALEEDLSARAEEVERLDVARQVTARQLAALAGVALALVGAETVEELTAVVIDHGLSALGADGGAVAVLAADDATALELTITAGFGAGTQRDYARLPLDGPLPACVAAATGRPVLLADRGASLAFDPQMAQVMTSTGSQAFACLPLRVGERLLGSLTVGWRAPQAFHAAEVALLDAFAAQCAQALDRILVRDAERARARAAARMSEALQRSLLTEPPQPDHLQITVRYVPAAQDAQVGGDWYDAFTTRDGTTSLVIGDVAGHDRDAAAVMGQVRNLLRGIGYAIGQPPAAVLSELDRGLRDLAVPALATCLLAQVEQSPAARRAGLRVLRWSSAGHPPPLLLVPGRGAELLRTEPDLLLGLDPETARADHERVLEPGATVLLYTDGLVERRGASLDDGLDWLVGAVDELAVLPLDQLCDALLAQLPGGVEDDVALLGLRAHPEDRPRPADAGPQVLATDMDPDTGPETGDPPRR